MEKPQPYSFLESLIDGAAIVGVDGQLFYCNGALARLCELPLRQLRKQKTLDEFLLSNSVLSSDNLKVQEGASLYEEMNLITTGKKPVRVQVSVQPILDESGQKRFLIFIHDVSLEERLQNKYRIALEQKDKKIADISLLLDISTALTGARDTQTIIRSVANTLLIKSFSKTVGYFTLTNTQGSTLMTVLKSPNSESEILEFSQENILECKDFWTDTSPAVLTGESYPSLFKFFAAKINIEKDCHLYAIPLKSTESTREIIFIFKSPESPEGQEDYLDLVRSIAMQSNIALESAHFFESSITDEMTGLYNKRYFAARLQSEINRAGRTREHISLVIFDIDHFKKINDTYGHPAGDKVIREIASITKTLGRTYDVAARYGGEEFVIIMPTTQPDGAMIFTERLRKKIESHVVTSDKHSLKVTASFGIATFPDQGSNMDSLISLADKALYFAKKSGRNQTKCYGPECETNLDIAKT